MIAKDYRKREGQRTNAPGQPQITVTEVPYKQNSVWTKSRQQLLVLSPPGAMQVTSDRETKIRQSRCLGCCHPARSGLR